MRTSFQRNGLTAAALLLALPTAWFIVISVLKFELGIDAPYDVSEPLFQSMGLQEDLGWNINLLILLGPVIGFLLCVFQVLNIKWEFTKEEDFRFHFTIRRRWFPIFVAAFSVSLLALLTLYLFGENCTC